MASVLHETTEENSGITSEDPTMNPDNMEVELEGPNSDMVEVEVLPDTNEEVPQATDEEAKENEEDVGSGSDTDGEIWSSDEDEDDEGYDSEEEEEVEELGIHEEYY